jgi:endonuclease/exonuclease/phosphatase family metal-dependent hydrolase
MRLRSIIILLALCLCNSAHPVSLADSSRVVRVLSFNILHGATTKGDFDLDRIAEVIMNADPDLVALQEVDYRTNRAQKYDLATELGCRTGMIPLFARAMYYDDGEYGEAVLSKHTFLRTRNIALPYSPGNEPRSALEVVSVLPSGDTVAFIGTHLDHIANETDRLEQAKKINEVFASNRYPSILAGDLNAIPGSETINILEELWSPSYDKKKIEYTYPSSNPVKKIDYVMYYPEDRWRVIDTRVIEDSVASDHCAYLVTLELLD